MKRKVHVVGGGRGMWAFPIRQSVKVNGVSYDRPPNPFRSENDSLIISTDANPSPGLSRVRSSLWVLIPVLLTAVLDCHSFSKG